jgi:hypothetical protein
MESEVGRGGEEGKEKETKKEKGRTYHDSWHLIQHDPVLM